MKSKSNKIIYMYIGIALILGFLLSLFLFSDFGIGDAVKIISDKPQVVYNEDGSNIVTLRWNEIDPLTTKAVNIKLSQYIPPIGASQDPYTCKGTCGTGCTVIGCDPKNGGCSSCACSGSSCITSCDCKKDPIVPGSGGGVS